MSNAKPTIENYKLLIRNLRNNRHKQIMDDLLLRQDKLTCDKPIKSRALRSYLNKM